LLDFFPVLSNKVEYRRQPFTRLNERAVEYAFVFKHLARICPSNVLDVGTGRSALPRMIRDSGFIVTATDNITDYWPSGMINRHFYIVNDNVTKSKLKGQYDFITCVSVLEHIVDSDAAVGSMFRLMEEGDYLLLTFLYTEQSFNENVYELPGAGYGRDAAFICRSYSREQLKRWLNSFGGGIVEQEYWQFWEGAYWTVGRQVIPPRKVQVSEKHHLSCLLIKKKDSACRIEIGLQETKKP